MIKLPALPHQKSTLMRKLFRYMFVFALVLLTLLFIGMFLIGGFTGTKSRIADTLHFQSEVFEQQVATTMTVSRSQVSSSRRTLPSLLRTT